MVLLGFALERLCIAKFETALEFIGFACFCIRKPLSQLGGFLFPLWFFSQVLATAMASMAGIVNACAMQSSLSKVSN